MLTCRSQPLRLCWRGILCYPNTEAEWRKQVGNAAGRQVFGFKEATSTCVFCEHQGHAGKCGLSSPVLGFGNLLSTLARQRCLRSRVPLSSSPSTQGGCLSSAPSTICRHLAFNEKQPHTINTVVAKPAAAPTAFLQKAEATG